MAETTWHPKEMHAPGTNCFGKCSGPSSGERQRNEKLVNDQIDLILFKTRLKKKQTQYILFAFWLLLSHLIGVTSFVTSNACSSFLLPSGGIP